MGDTSRWSPAPDPWDDDPGGEQDAFSARSEPVRAAMRALGRELARELVDLGDLRLAAAIELAPNLDRLLILRTIVFDALVRARGEPRARDRIARLDAVFLRAWPDGPVARA